MFDGTFNIDREHPDYAARKGTLKKYRDLYLGGSTRAALGLHRAAQALALVEGRDYVVPDDVKRLEHGSPPPLRVTGRRQWESRQIACRVSGRGRGA